MSLLGLSGMLARPGYYTLTCKANVGGEELVSTMAVDAELYDTDPIARSAMEESVRFHLLRQITDKWKPKIVRY